MIDSAMQVPVSQQMAPHMSYQTPMSQMGSTVIQLIDTSEVTRNFEMFIRGLKEDDSGRLVPFSKSLVSDDGAYRLIYAVKSVVNHIMSLGKTEEKEKYRVLKYNYQTWVEIVCARWYDLGMSEDTEQRILDEQIIITTMTNLAIEAINNPMDEGMRRFLKGSTHEFSFAQQGPPVKKGLMGTIKGAFGMSGG